MSLKVLVIGGYQCGKTSALATLFWQSRYGQIRDCLTVTDNTVPDVRMASLTDVTLELQQLPEINREYSRFFLLEKGATYSWWTYKLHLQIPGCYRSMEIEFMEVPGSFLNDLGSSHSPEIEEKVRLSDVILVAIDTPYLMGCTEEESRDICPESINLGTNRVFEIQNFLTHLDDNAGRDAKMVVFIPLKCEKWAKEPGGLNKVTERVREVYATHIQNLSAFAQMHISIIPMQTSGNILFSEFRNAYSYINEKGEKVRCCKITEEIIRLANGEHAILAQGEILYQDPEAIISGTHLMRPYAWYRVNHHDYSYALKNGDQLLYHILRFGINAYWEEEAKLKAVFKPMPLFFPPINRYKHWFGDLDKDDIKNIALHVNNAIIDDNDGIETLK